MAAEREEPTHKLQSVFVIVHQQNANSFYERLAASDRGGWAFKICSVSANGRVTVKVAPPPKPGLSARICPSCASTMALAIANPRPRPPN